MAWFAMAGVYLSVCGLAFLIEHETVLPKCMRRKEGCDSE